MTPADWTDALRSLLPEGYTPEPDEPQPQAPKPLPRLKVTLDKKRAGKTATIISGFDPDDRRAAELAKDLRRALSVGGSDRGGEILLQGDLVNKVTQLLKERGYKTNRQ